MTSRVTRAAEVVAIVLALTVAVSVGTAGAQSTAPATPPETRVMGPRQTPVKTKAAQVAKNRKKTAKAAADTLKTDKASAAGAAGHKPAARTLDEINIQGEIPVPQVLFITARDQRRFLDLQHRRYIRSSQRIGETTVMPSWIAVTPEAESKEPPR